jgi:dTDP-4-amino-4,6-dideoxygalactose transaminase
MSQKKNLVPMSSPDLDQSDLESVLATLKTNYLSIGPKIEEFEAMFREFSGAKHAIGVNSGTAGLHLCVRAAGIGQDDLVITTPFSFVSSTNVMLFEKAIPVFVDVDPQTGNMDTKLAAQAAADLTSGNQEKMQRWLPRKGYDAIGSLKSILAVDVFGQPADYAPLQEIARQHSLTLIEDSCEALGAAYAGTPAGRLGDFGVFAFYPNKQITTGEGGMIVTDDDRFAEMMRALRNQGRAPGDTWLQHTYLGYNYRMDEMSAALGISQMQRIHQLLKNRQRVAGWYSQKLENISGVETPYIAPATTAMSWFVYVIRLSAAIDREKAAEMLSNAGIPVRPYFLPIHLQPYMANQFGYRAGDFPVTEDLGKRSLALPFSGNMTEEQVDLVCDVLDDCLKKLM